MKGIYSTGDGLNSYWTAIWQSLARKWPQFSELGQRYVYGPDWKSGTLEGLVQTLQTPPGKWTNC